MLQPCFGTILHAPCREADDYLQDIKQQRSGPFAIYEFTADFPLHQNQTTLHGSFRRKLKEYPMKEDSMHISSAAFSYPILSFCPQASQTQASSSLGAV